MIHTSIKLREGDEDEASPFQVSHQRLSRGPLRDREAGVISRSPQTISDIKGSIGHFEKRSDANDMSMGLGFAFMDCVQALNKAIVHVIHHPSLDLKAGG